MFPRKLMENSQEFGMNLTSSSEYRIGDYGYGKNNVKIMHITRNGPVHTIREFEVNTHLKLFSHKDYLQGDNSDIVATDSQKNTVYVLAKKYGIQTPEEFALVLTSHFLNKYNHVKEAHVHVIAYPWERIAQQDSGSRTGTVGTYGGTNKKHNHAFVFTPIATRFCDVVQKRNGKPTIISGLRDLRVLKTTQSSFVNFVSDEFRTLEDQSDRIFSTIVESKWEYSTCEGIDFTRSWDIVKDTILKEFAGDPSVGKPSPSVQHTLYIAEKTVLDKIPQIASISMDMPNKHYFAFDTRAFQNIIPGENNDVFIPVDKPSGIIYAQLDRSQVNSKL